MDPPLCVNGCGFFGSYENKNMCSKCYKDHILKLNKNIIESFPNDQDLRVGEAKNESKTHMDIVDETSISNSDALESQKKKRCKSCNKKIGFTGFVCQCGNLFCGKHRYPNEHSCTVDFKQIGRQLLSEQNPLCKADKLDQKI